LVNYTVIGIVVPVSKTSEILTSAEFATIKRVSARRIRMLASTGRIPDARKQGHDWLIPAQADIDAGTRGPLLRTVIHTATVRAFKLIAELDRFQRDREIATAVKVQLMTSRERVKWLRAAWGPLQRQPLAQPSPRKASARHFKSITEKNRYDESVEIDSALVRTRSSRAARA
jgi:hypothetical protein